MTVTYWGYQRLQKTAVQLILLECILMLRNLGLDANHLSINLFYFIDFFHLEFGLLFSTEKI